MRPMSMAQAIRATEITTHFKGAHGAPLHIGDPAAIGIKDINNPDFGEAAEMRDGEVPVFWGCGVTPQSVCLNVKSELMITLVTCLLRILRKVNYCIKENAISIVYSLCLWLNFYTVHDIGFGFLFSCFTLLLRKFSRLTTFGVIPRLIRLYSFVSI